MAKICAHCGKKGMRGNFVSHSKQRTKRVFKPNLHSYKMLLNGIYRKVMLCATCLRTEKKKHPKTYPIATISIVKPKVILPPEHPHYKGERPEVVKAVIPEEVKIEMKEKEEKKKKKSGQSDDLALIEEIMSQSLQKEPKKKK